MASYDSYCSSCNVACESTNSCNKCNSCQKCNNAACEETCILIQSFCKTSGQKVGSFSFGQCVSSDQLFLSKANWNKIFTFIIQLVYVTLFFNLFMYLCYFKTNVFKNSK